MGSGLSDGEPDLAAQLGADHSVLRLPAGDPESDLHHQRDRVAEHVAAQDRQNARLVSDRGCRDEAPVSGSAKRVEKMDHANSKLERGVEPLRHTLAGANASLGTGGGMTAKAGEINRKRISLEWGILPQTPWDLPLTRQDCWTARPLVTPGRAESRPLSRRSGCVPAEPCPSPRCNQYRSKS